MYLMYSPVELRIFSSFIVIVQFPSERLDIKN